MRVYTRKRPRLFNSAYTGVFWEGKYVGSMNLTWHMRRIMHKNGYTTVLWEY